MKKDPADLEGQIRASIYQYPSLYRDDNYELSRLHVLGHIFLCYGTALEWHPDGYLTYLDYNGKTKDGYLPLRIMDELPEGFFEKELWYIEVNDTRKKEFEAKLKGNFFYWNGKHSNNTTNCVFEADEKLAKELTVEYRENDPSLKTFIKEMAAETGQDPLDFVHPFHAEAFVRSERKRKEKPAHLKKTYLGGYDPYPMCEYSPIVEMVNKRVNSCHIENFDLENIRPDWAKGAVDIARYCLAWYKDENNHKYIGAHPDNCMEKTKEFYNEDPQKYRKGCDGTYGDIIFTDDMTIEDWCWASWKHHLAQQIGWFEKVIEMYDNT